ncbi:unnamed protein product [Rotaria socialis]|uniref:Uncharacterized protein n=1 Tax=Rotaria socialis TaxID=392032 RepID=A0A818B149_9BILA|nr:unnamed protein product [Rotaria socialis]
MAQYDRCSTTNGCACFLIAGATNFGLCSYQYLVECSQLTLCENSTNLCPRDYECVHHPRCRDVPICYPVRADNVELCPPILGKRKYIDLKSQVQFESFLKLFLRH